MPSLNKASLRQEFDTLKGEFERLCAAGKMGRESKVLFQTLLTLFELLMAVFMEKHTPKNSRNSSLPSSQTEKDDETATRPGSKTKGQGEHQGRCRNTRTLETVEISTVSTCACCGKDLGNAPCQGLERRTLVDIVFEKHLRHVDAQIKQCPVCQSLNKGVLPADMAGPLQYGAGIKYGGSKQGSTAKAVTCPQKRGNSSWAFRVSPYWAFARPWRCSPPIRHRSP